MSEQHRPSLRRHLLPWLKNLFVRNWGIKILSLVLALALWSVLIAQDPSLTREKSMSDGRITVVGTENIKRNGFVVTGGLEDLPAVSIRADIPQAQYQSASAANYNPRIDLSRISSSGEQEVKISTTNSTSYGTVLEVSPATVTLQVDDYITRYRIPVIASVTGSAPEGWFPTGASCDPPMVSISGPRSIVDQVVRAVAAVDLSLLAGQEGTVRTAVPLKLMGADGEIDLGSSVEITSEGVLLDSIVVEQKLDATKTLDLNKLGLVTGTPAEGYEIKSISITPDTVVAAGSSEVLAHLDSLFLDLEVDVSGLSAPVNRQIRIRKPDELSYLSQSSVTVAVEIGPVHTSRTFQDIWIDGIGADSGLKNDLDQTCTVTVEGEMLWVRDLKYTDIRLEVDLSGLGAGEHPNLPVQCTIHNSGEALDSVTLSPETVTVTLTPRATE